MSSLGIRFQTQDLELFPALFVSPKKLFLVVFQFIFELIPYF